MALCVCVCMCMCMCLYTINGFLMLGSVRVEEIPLGKREFLRLGRSVSSLGTRGTGNPETHVLSASSRLIRDFLEIACVHKGEWGCCVE